MRCEDKIVLVTGAQQGIGRAVALRFARDGADVALNFFDDRAAAEGIATQIEAWTEWVIPLQVFADKGVDLTEVDRIAIGFGDRDNPQQNSGDGTMFFDDIRLYRPRGAAE